MLFFCCLNKGVHHGHLRESPTFLDWTGSDSVLLFCPGYRGFQEILIMWVPINLKQVVKLLEKNYLNECCVKIKLYRFTIY